MKDIPPPSRAELACSYRVQAGNPGALSEEELRTLQLARLNQTLEWAQQHCPFHAGRLTRKKLSSLRELSTLPVMDQSAFSEGMVALLGLPHNELNRIVTVATSGTTGEPKRIAFHADEHEDIVAYLASGMRMLARPTETVAVLFPCHHAGSLGHLICEGVAQVPARACAYGMPDTERGFTHLAHTCIKEKVVGLVGFPQHIFAFARWCAHHGIIVPVRSVLLSADTVVPSVKQEIKRIWDAQVFAHYGTTEMGYGGAVECGCGSGMHIRETDLLYEVIDPETTRPCADGEWGELVFTTLNRKAMPFIRYRTGDITRMLPGDCACGSVLRRIDMVKGRFDVVGQADSKPGAPACTGVSLPSISMYDLENAVFSLPGVLDCAATWDCMANRLHLEVQLLPGYHVRKEDSVADVFPGTCEITQTTVDDFHPFYPAKRMLMLKQVFSAHSA